MTGAVLAGIDVGGTNTKVLLATPDLGVLDRIDLPTPAHDGGDAILDAAEAAVRSLLDRHRASLAGVGVGAAGVVDPTTGTVLVTANSFTGWAGYGVTDAVAARLGVPATLDNDVNAFLLGEVAAGAVAGEPDVLGMTLGTGVGGALVLGGTLFGGPHGAAGEIGHVPGFGDTVCTCGARGHLETVAGARGIADRYAERTGRRIGTHEVATAARTGDRDAQDVFATAGWGIARAVLLTAGILDVTTVVIGGGVARSWDLLEPAVTAALAAEPPVSGAAIRVEQSVLGADAVALGAAAQVRRVVLGA
ncbi:ROK family protein [Curtobacterium sp. MCJR17_055]|uniref:ROK family protein n=2 Tax=Curtobacterium TaxID=2034 RepID=UPI000D8EDEAB|nr:MULTISPECIES: ROK family protein [unclassified Curtobacterium]PYY38061.1 ROK family protein [Curtobacterium sp. MCBD17_029]PYY57086.1 ROK family protein [Curtobacterium sp. MCJR17_055]PYY61998.1 ROK family protein [Curtobacterium sp. MCPF17_015]